MKTTSETKPNRSIAIFAILALMVINAVFFGLELTVFNDAADLNNSILMILWVVSIVGLVSMRKLGAALATFTLTYAFSFNAFNVVYNVTYFDAFNVIYFPEVVAVNAASALINLVAIIYMYRSIFANKFR